MATAGPEDTSSSSGAAAGPCLDDEALARFAEGALDDRALAQADAHLDACADCAAVLAGLAGAAPGEATGALIRRGTSLGRYVVLDFLGAGGMGVVYSAYDPELERKVALKVLRGGAASDSRLLAEARAMAKVSSAHVVAIFDVAAVGDHGFIAMERVDGVSLRRWLEAQRSWREILEVFAGAGRGLADAHAAGLVHRDFKPDNVLVDVHGRARVTDFGLAHAAGTTGPAQGTLRYMAPEVRAGARADARADQWAFCLALKDALAGAKVPPALRRALERGLAERPEARFPSMPALLDTLALHPRSLRRRLLAGALAALALGAVGWQLRERPRQPDGCELAAGRPQGLWDDARRDRARSAFVATGAPFAEAAFTSADEALSRYATGWASAYAEACRATYVRREQPPAVLALRLACLEERRTRAAALSELLSEADARAVEHAPHAVEELPPLSTCGDVKGLLGAGQPAPAAAAEVARAREALARAQARFDSGQWREALEGSAPVAALAERVGYAPLRAEALLLQGSARAELGDYAAAAAVLYQGALAAERAQAGGTAARAYLKLVRVVGALQWRLEPGRLFALHAEESVAAADEGDALKAELADAQAQLLYYGEGRLEPALRRERAALELFDRALGSDHSRTAWARGFAAWLLGELGQHGEAASLAQQAVAARERTLGPSHPDVGKAYFNLAAVELFAGQADHAAVHQARARKLWLSALGAEHPLVVRADVQGAEVLALEGRLDLARAAYERALPRLERTSGAQSPRFAEALDGYARVLLRLRRAGEALAVARRALAAQQASFGAGHVWLAQSQLGEGEALLALGRRAEALAPLRQAVAALAQHGERPAALAQARALLAHAEGQP